MLLPLAGEAGLPYIRVNAYRRCATKGQVMNSATFSHRLVSPQATEAGGFWHATRVVVDVLLSSRDYMAQFDQVEQLMRRAHRLEATQPARAEAIRQQAIDLIH